MTRWRPAVAAFLGMEPVAYAAHRWVMHGAGWFLHRSHHERAAARLQANDWFPVAFASFTVVAMAAGRRWRRARPLLPAGAGVTAYGAVYAFVHDLCIHGRLGRLPRLGPLQPLASAHELHHRFGGEPYGMLLPFVPRAVRERAVLEQAAR